MAASLDCAVWLDAIKCVWAEMDGMSIANIDLPGFKDLPDKRQCSFGMRDGESYSPACFHFILINTQHDRNVVQTSGILSRPPSGDQSLLTNKGFRPLPFGLLRFLCGSLGFAFANNSQCFGVQLRH